MTISSLLTLSMYTFTPPTLGGCEEDEDNDGGDDDNDVSYVVLLTISEDIGIGIN